MRKNHKTTTLLVAMAAIAATLLAAGTVAALGSNQFAFAHREYKKSYGQDNKYGGDQGRDNYGKDKQRDGDQYLKCIVIGGGGDNGGKTRAGAAQTSEDNGGGISDNSCNNFDGNNPEMVLGPRTTGDSGNW